MIHISPSMHVVKSLLMTTKVVHGMVVATWVVSVILASVVIAFAPHPILWPFGTIFAQRGLVRLIILVPCRIASAAFIIATNVFLYYKVCQSNKKAKENTRTGSSGEETTKLKKVMQKRRSQTRTAVSLLMLGGIEGIANILVPVMYMLIRRLGPTGELYAIQLFSYVVHSCIRLSHSLIYGLYMKQIRQRLPKYNIRPCPQYPRRSRVVVLNQSN